MVGGKHMRDRQLAKWLGDLSKSLTELFLKDVSGPLGAAQG